MEIRSLSFLYEGDYNVGTLFSMFQQWQTNAIFNMDKPRETGCIMNFCGCSAEYYFKDTCLFVPKGSVLYIPAGAIYKIRFLECEEGRTSTILINFNFLTPEGRQFDISKNIKILSKKSNSLINGAFNDAAREFSAAVVSLPTIKIAIYQIFTELSHEKHKQKLYSKKFSPIADGIVFLEKELHSRKSIAEIADMCHVSVATFRRLFKEYSGMSPMEYRITSRIEYAKKLLNIGTMDTAEIASELGFEDCAYFCRIFKKYVGLTPGAYRNGNIYTNNEYNKG